MESSLKHIEHPGVVNRIEGQRLFVKIESRSACGNCYANSHCSMSEMQEKIVEIPVFDGGQYMVGQAVIVSFERSLGFKALLLGYMIPLIILLVAIIVLMTITRNELLSAIVGIGLLLPYYVGLYLYRSRLKDHFHFRILRHT
jgi:sigma-E factor negative regulatory protein RseC